jgi:hypothetical protein
MNPIPNWLNALPKCTPVLRPTGKIGYQKYALCASIMFESEVRLQFYSIQVTESCMREETSAM